MQIPMKGRTMCVLYSVGGGFLIVIFTGGRLGAVPALTHFMDKRKELE